MSILKIARMGHPVLRQTAQPVDDPSQPAIARLVRDMIETMQDAGGIGLAAPQVHVAMRIVVFHLPRSRAGDPEAEEGAPDGPLPLTVLINPVIEPVRAEQDVDWEACLSLPGLTGRVPRYRHIRYRAAGLTGAVIEREASGFHARAVQHECDHLDGILYPQRMADLRQFGFADEIRRYPPVELPGRP
jgi:peptide deformylase